MQHKKPLKPSRLSEWYNTPSTKIYNNYNTITYNKKQAIESNRHRKVAMFYILFI